MLQKAKKKPVEIEFIQYTDETNIGHLYEWSNNAIQLEYNVNKNEKQLVVETLEGRMLVNKDDYIIKGVHGEFYPCKPDIFHKTYEVL